MTDRHTLAPAGGDSPACREHRQRHRCRLGALWGQGRSVARQETSGKGSSELASEGTATGQLHNGMRTGSWRRAGKDHVRSPAIKVLHEESASRGGFSVEGENGAKTTVSGGSF